MTTLSEIEARLKAATPGPWRRPLDTRYKATVDAILPDGEEPTRWRGGIDPDGNRERVPVALVPTWSNGKHLRKRGGRDLELIAHAPDDIAWLVAEVKAAKRESLEATERLRMLSAWAGAMIGESNHPQYGRDVRTLIESPIDELREAIK